ncbi:AAA family ATPase [Streptomyces sp. APSN-46.1]|uniref:AAA family ATPase n=1 Tax=Streptomyces sp. APSN-46.1 TaxID=2929049 RepID=UPI001FB41C9F|nr:AAA family ATPase [Streptomyces sp. APSN-46.1]MCJ1680772.1 AAA family ATPase [Streptomyces sp. APSN-46.1]
MPTRQARTTPRTRRSMEILAEQSDELHHAELWKRVKGELPPAPEDAETYDNGQEKGENAWRWQTSDLVMAGWLRKNNGLWRITNLGREALREYPEPDVFYDTARATLTYWNRNKHGFEYAIRLVGAIPSGRWLALDDLAAATGLGRDALSRWLWGVRPAGAHRVLDSDGRPAPEVQADAPETKVALSAVAEEQGRPVGAAAGEHLRIGVDGLQPYLVSEDARGPHSASAWLVRGSSTQGRTLVSQWLSEGFCSLPASRLDSVTTPITREELRLRVEDRYAHLSYNKRGELAAEFDLFLNRMHTDDLVCATSGGTFFLGRITSGPEWVPSLDDRSNLRRAVEWSGMEIAFEELPEELRGRLSSQHDVVDLTGAIDLLRELSGARRTPGVPEDESALIPLAAGAETARPGTELRVPAPELASKLLVGEDWLGEVRDLLQDRKQLIFYGPPGTGKTYLAQHIAEHLAGDPRAVKLVQFHPSYAYEDFFEGFRPAVQEGSGAGALSFALRPGPFRQLVDLADEDPDTPYFLIIDEINRANLAKVFGELYFVLEYRDRTVSLQYSGEFRLPQNVFVIGTMNTADRSIALVDAAMRRRFAFLSLHPDDEPTRDLLSRWVEEKEAAGVISPNEDVPALHRELNRRIEDKDFKIGPSYLMRPSAYDEGGLERVWKTAILPLLEEHHYGDDRVDVRARYGLPALRRAVLDDTWVA